MSTEKEGIMNLSYEDVRLQEEVVDFDSRVSDLAEGDERRVGVWIGARNYKERFPAHVSRNQELSNYESKWCSDGLDYIFTWIN